MIVIIVLSFSFCKLILYEKNDTIQQTDLGGINMFPTEHAWIMKNLEGSFSVEGITISDEMKKKLQMLSNDETTSEELIAELISKYKDPNG